MYMHVIVCAYVHFSRGFCACVGLVVSLPPFPSTSSHLPLFGLFFLMLWFAFTKIHEKGIKSAMKLASFPGLPLFLIACNIRRPENEAAMRLCLAILEV